MKKLAYLFLYKYKLNFISTQTNLVNFREYSIKINIKLRYRAEIERKDCESEYLSFCHLESGGVWHECVYVCLNELSILTRL